MSETKKKLARLLVEECNNMEDILLLLRGLFKDTIEQMLEHRDGRAPWLQ